jgi:HEAT repeat protein
MPTDVTLHLQRLLRPSDDETAWYRAVRALDCDQAVPLLATALGDNLQPQAARLQAALMLGVLADPRALPALNDALLDPNPVLRARAAEAIARVAPEDADVIENLVELLSDDDGYVRETAARMLGQVRHRPALGMLQAMSTQDPDPASRRVALEAVRAIEEQP